jgi:ATP-dependent Lhr-like helicase
LTTPESLEVMLVSQSVDAQRLFANLQVIVVDEIHAFAGDDRGWHLLCLQPVQKREEHPPVGLKCVRDGRNLEHAPPTPRR